MPSDLTFNVFGHDVSAGKTLKGVQSQADQTAKGVGSSFKKAGALIAGAFAVNKVKDFFSDSIAEAREAQKVGAQTTAVLKSTGGAAKISAGQVGDLAGAISKKTGIDDEAIQSGENMLLTFTGIRNEVGKGKDIFNQATQAVTDMSVATGGSMTGSAVMLGKALNDPIAGISKLTKIGVTFTQQQKDQIAAMTAAGDTAGAQKVILDELAREFGGSAAAQATAADKMTVAFGNIKEQVGTALLPVLDSLEGVVTNDVIPAFSGTVSWLQENWHWLKYVAGTVGGLWVAWKGYSIVRVALGVIRTNILLVKTDLVALRTTAITTGTALNTSLAGGAAGAATKIGLLAGSLGLLKFAALASVSTNADQIGVMKELVGQYKMATNSTDMSARAIIEWASTTKAGMAGMLKFNSVLGDLKVTADQLAAGVAGDDAAYKAFIATAKQHGKVTGDDKELLDKLHEAFKNTAASATDAAGATDKNTGAAKANKAAIDGETGSMKKQVSASDALLASIKKLSGDKISAAQAELRFKDGLASATQQVKDNGKSLASNTDKGRSNREWLLDQISSLHDVAQAQLDAGQATGKVSGKLQQNESDLRRAAKAAGFNADQVDALIRKYGKLPRSVYTKVKVTADDSGFKTVWREVVDNLSSAPNATIYINGQAKFRTNAQGTGFFAGGATRWNEQGGEIAVLPTGTRIIAHTAAESQQRMYGGAASSSDSGPAIVAELQAMRRENRDLQSAIASMRLSIDSRDVGYAIGTGADRLGRGH